MEELKIESSTIDNVNPRISDFQETSLGPQLDFLKEPDSRAKLSKIRHELDRTIAKIKRKKSDKNTMAIFTLITAVLLSFPLLSMEKFALTFSVGALILFVGLTVYVYKKVILPLKKDLVHLNTKEVYLREKINDISQSLREGNVVETREVNKKRRSKKEIPDF